MTERVYRGEIYYIGYAPTSGSEQTAGRPAVIVSNDVGNEHSELVEVVYLTTQEKKPLPTHVKINSLSRESTALCEQICTVSKQRVEDFAGQATEGEMKAIDEALAISLGIGLEKTNKAVEKWAETLAKNPPAVEKPAGDGGATLAAVRAERDLYKGLYERIYEDLMKKI